MHGVSKASNGGGNIALERRHQIEGSGSAPAGSYETGGCCFLGIGTGNSGHFPVFHFSTLGWDTNLRIIRILSHSWFLMDDAFALRILLPLSART